MRFLKIIYFSVLFVSCLSKAQNQLICERVTADIKSFDEKVDALTNEFHKLKKDEQDLEWVKKKFYYMNEVDQYLREKAINLPFERQYDQSETQCFWNELSSRWQKIDSNNTKDLKALMLIYGWFYISKFGIEINDMAWLLAQHADLDRPFQKQVLKLISEAYPKGEDTSKHFAFLFDRVTWYGDGLPQRYATQGYCKGPGDWVPHPTEDFEHVNERRLQMGLSSFEENKARLNQVCH